MADVSVRSNSPLQPDAIQNPYAPKQPKGFWENVAEVGRAVIRPIHTSIRYGRYFFASADSPEKALERIASIAETGLERAAIRGVKIEPEAAQRLFNLEAASEAASRNASEVGPVADISPFPSNPQVTRAPDLQARVDDTNWKDKIPINRDRVANKISAYSTLLQMCQRSDVKLKDKDHLSLMDIVKKVTEGNEGKSLWDFFTQFAETHDLSFFQKLRAAWFYFFYYYTNLITDTLKAYLTPAIDNLTKDLIKENSDTRSLFFRVFIDNLNQFLVEDTRATKDFAFEKEHGDLKDVRDRAIERHYGFSLPDLCKAFGDKRVDEDAPTVPLFTTAQKIPLIGYFFKGLEKFVNHFIIRKNMKSWILPYALESSVKNGLEATQPHNLPFRLHLTRFLTSRLQQLKIELEKPGPSAKAPGPFPGTELLGPTIKNLMMTLELEPLKTSLELRKKFQEIEKGKWFYDKKIEKSMQEAIIDAGNLLFKYLNETAASGELFARLLELSCAPFSGDVTSEEVLKAEFEAETQKLEKLCKDVGGKIVRDAIAKTVNGQRPEDATKVAHETFDAGKATANKALDELNKLCRSMTEKINQSAHSPTAENNIQQDIALFLQIMKVFANRKEVQQAIEGAGLNKVDRDAIWRLMTPLYERAAKIEERILKLQELQDHYPTHATVEGQLKLINDLFKSIRDQFHTQPRHLQNPLIQTLGKAAEDISKGLGSRAEVTLITQRYIKEIAELSESIAKRQKAIDAIYAFYPPRLNEQEVEQEGLLDQLLNYERGIHPPGFKPLACLEEIRKNLEHFTADEKRELETLIGNGSNLKSKWSQLGAVLQRIYQQHMDLKNRDKAALDKTLDQATQWTQNMILSYGIVKEKDHSKMRVEMRLISIGISSLQNDAFRARLNIPPSLSKLGTTVSGSLFSLILGGLGSLVGPMTAIVGAGVGAGLGEYAYAHPDENNHRPGLKTLAGMAGTAAAVATGGTYWPVAAAAGSAITGWHAKKAVQSGIQSHVQTKVLDILESAYKLGLDPRIYKATTTRTMKALAEA